jgi:DNA-binding transcriptional regulator LsrR (DeoR family)
MTKRALIVAFVVFGLASGLSVAQEDVCHQFASEVKGKTFVAKVPLYDTKVDMEGIVKLERDRQEVPEGKEFNVIKVSCGSSKIAMTIQQKASYKTSKVDIYLLFKKTLRFDDDARESLKTVTDHIFEEANSE